jgi:hypothetical protein
MKELIKILFNGNYSCVIHNRRTRSFYRKGVIDLYTLLRDEPSFLDGAAVADRIVGKAAAALMILGGVCSVYTDVISLPALVLLREAGIDTDFRLLVPFIQNTDKTDWCPLEKICYDENSPGKIFRIIEQYTCKDKCQNITICF